jgi:hypothetical protein
MTQTKMADAADLGSTQARIMAALEAKPHMSYDELVTLTFGPSWTDPQRNSMARAIRSLEVRGLLHRTMIPPPDAFGAYVGRCVKLGPPKPRR